MERALKIHDVVALLKAMPSEELHRGQVGTVVEVYKSGRYEVEFADAGGQTLALLTLPVGALLRLSYDRAGKRRGSKLVA
jgi:hypothetical protein